MSRTRMKIGVAGLLAALAGGGCGAQSRGRPASRNQCQATVGFQAPINQPLGRQQLAFARLAVANDNSSHDTRIRLLAVDTRLDPAVAMAAADQFAGQPRVVAVVGPATDREVSSVGPIFARAGLGFISGSATGSTLTNGANPTFFRVVPSERLQGSQQARFVVTRLRARGVLVVDGQDAYARQLVQAMIPTLRSARVAVAHVSASERLTPVATLAARVTPASPIIALAWQSPRAAQQFGRLLAAQRKTVTIVGPDRLYAPGVLTLADSYVSAYAPDIAAVPGDAAIARLAKVSPGAGATLGATVYAATHVVDDAVAAVCRNGQAASRSAVLAALRMTDEAGSVLGIPIRFRGGELVNARWFMYRIAAGGSYKLVTNP